MSEFIVSYGPTSYKGIKYLYSGFPRVDHIQSCDPHPSLAKLRLRNDSRQLKHDVLKYSRFVHEDRQDAFRPESGAFRSLSIDYVNQVVSRLQRPRMCSMGLCTSSEEQMLEEMDKDFPKYRGRKRMHAGDIDKINERMARGTTASTIRLGLRRNQRETLTDIGN